jgi:hypothetical protein
MRRKQRIDRTRQKQRACERQAGHLDAAFQSALEFVQLVARLIDLRQGHLPTQRQSSADRVGRHPGRPAAEDRPPDILLQVLHEPVQPSGGDVAAARRLGD